MALFQIQSEKFSIRFWQMNDNVQNFPDLQRNRRRMKSPKFWWSFKSLPIGNTSWFSPPFRCWNLQLMENFLGNNLLETLSKEQEEEEVSVSKEHHFNASVKASTVTHFGTVFDFPPELKTSVTPLNVWNNVFTSEIYHARLARVGNWVIKGKHGELKVFVPATASQKTFWW